MRSALNTQRGWLLAGILAGGLWTGARLAGPLLAAAAINQGILKHDGHAILVYTIAILLVGVVQAGGTALRRYTAFRIAYRVETDLRERLFAHLQLLHFAFHDQAQTGQLMAGPTATSSRSTSSSSCCRSPWRRCSCSPACSS